MATITSIASGRWNADASTVWDSGTAPTYGDVVVIEAGHVIELDGDCKAGTGTYPNDSTPYSPSSNLSLWLKGTLKASRTVDSSLDIQGVIGADVESGWQSELDFGKEGDEIPAGVNFTWHMNTKGITGLGYYYGVGFYGRNSSRSPKIYMRSAHHRTRNTYLVRAYPAGATSIEVNDATGWTVGDTLILAPQWTTVTSDPRTNFDYDEVTITSVSGNTIGITATTYAHGYDDSKDVEAGAVSNITSNVKITGDGDDRIFPSIYMQRGVLDLKDVAGEYMNNMYALNTVCFRIGNAGYYDGSYQRIESCAFGVDSRGYTSRNAYAIIYPYAPYQTYGGQSYSKDTVLYAKVASGRYWGSAFTNYYGGRNSLIEDCNVYPMTSYCTVGFSNYQQPTTYNHCKAFNCSYSFQLHDNVTPDANDCWSVGTTYNINTYNGDAEYNDLHVRWARYIGATTSGWRGKFVANRMDFEDKHVYETDPQKQFYSHSGLPDGNVFQFVDLQNETDNQRWVYSYGQKWWELTETRNDPHSIGMKSLSDTYVIPHERTFNAETGDSMLVGLYVKNLTSSYIGTLTMSILQGSEVIATQDFDLTTLTPGEWTLLSISGTATKTMTTTFKIEYKGNGGEIAITDFSQPFTADQKAQAKAVWAELLSENKVSGSFGDYLGQKIESNIRGSDDDDLKTISEQLDTVQSDVSSVASDVWSEDITSYTDAKTFGGRIKKLLTVAKFLGLK